MLRLRPKIVPERNNDWRCFFCIHVRTATIALGVWHFMLQAVALVVLLMIFQDPNMLSRLYGESNLPTPYDNNDDIPVPLPTPLSNIDQPAYPYTNQPTYRRFYREIETGGFVAVCTTFITLMLIYGATKRKASHLLPFFLLQLVDFIITTLTATGYLCYLRSVKRVVAESRNIPFKAELLRLSPAALSMVVLIAFLCAMFFKAYCISIVWRCYKYLTYQQYVRRSLLSSPSLSRGPRMQTPPPPAAETILAPLPDYEEALKQCPPPSYQAATGHLLEEQDPPLNNNVPVANPRHNNGAV